MNKKPIQKILFGSPGTGKSHRITGKIIPDQLEIKSLTNVFKTVFHPEYTYGDFMGKLLPISKKKKMEYRVEYIYYAGHFLKALARAYRNITDTYIDDSGNILDTPAKPAENVVLVIDEINRGNSSAIFGTVFQLLDRDSDGWSSYGITISDLEYEKLLLEMGFENKSTYNNYDEQLNNNFQYNQHTGLSETKKDRLIESLYKHLNERQENKITKVYFKDKWIFIPPNLSILASMNTSDNSIYFMDNAFKRRWDWEFIDVEDDDQQNSVAHRKVVIYGIEKCNWIDLVDKLNHFICSKHKEIRKIEDKQIGYRFINEEIITEEHLKNKLMFFLWDSVFSSNKKPLALLLELQDGELVTFGQFTKQVDRFVDKTLSN
jgi:5-methylcytosine-specific restriction enzyme B